ncbi:transglycosylase domain-containing protein, partial [Candidatus Microgenomates bacterium]|nr:transglycosylase domain-containing protein [Candidatus Microgenomates bacterium]
MVKAKKTNKKTSLKKRQPKSVVIFPKKGKIPSLKEQFGRILKIRSRRKMAAVLMLFILIAGGIFFLFRDLPSPTKLASREIPQTTKIYDRSGQLLYEIYGDQNRTLVPLSEIPDSLKKATIAMEDKDFYRHGAINPLGGILRAMKEIVFSRKLQGGSTITQQLVKSALLSPERTIQRKLREFVLATFAERLYSKDEILEMYLNQVPYGGTAWGVEAASQTYFGKHVKDLSLAEAAL